ncbi:hypothetical protein TL16_g13065 [Triparma laevis f. inornata]|uniref:NADH dehydrogenase [ubiquinone] 1 alpha subcomplex subunit 12 n=1 Tax=Triparma laevis f. inornata TaxID=1714386 RepID=A0A9W7BWK5_9STRA|nr:hypothetical protein TL16_g13065 [Triparma laevis f. inornata]
MYVNGDYPFKFGRLVGTDAGGNKYFENTVDYTFGQHRWVEPSDIHNYDPSSIPPEWHGWMHHMSDSPGTFADEKDFIDTKMSNVNQILANSSAPYNHSIGQTNEPPPNALNHQHNMSQLRSRGWKVGNIQCYLPPGIGDTTPPLYYTQPGSPYSGKQAEYVAAKMAGKSVKKTTEPESFKGATSFKEETPAGMKATLDPAILEAAKRMGA